MTLEFQELSQATACQRYFNLNQLNIDYEIPFVLSQHHLRYEEMHTRQIIEYIQYVQHK